MGGKRESKEEQRTAVSILQNTVQKWWFIKKIGKDRDVSSSTDNRTRMIEAGPSGCEVISLQKVDSLLVS